MRKRENNNFCLKKFENLSNYLFILEVKKFRYIYILFMCTWLIDHYQIIFLCLIVNPQLIYRFSLDYQSQKKKKNCLTAILGKSYFFREFSFLEL